MESVAISEFKATCLAVLERVRRTKKPVLITRFGQPVAEVVPPSAPPRPKSWVGSMVGSAKILGDIASPVGQESNEEPGRRDAPVVVTRSDLERITGKRRSFKQFLLAEGPSFRGLDLTRDKSRTRNAKL